jgi:hypothetical protein
MLQDFFENILLAKFNYNSLFIIVIIIVIIIISDYA